MTIDEAYAAMLLYLEAFYKRTHRDDIGALLGGMDLIAPHTTMDPVAWYDWEQAVSMAPAYLEKLEKQLRESGGKILPLNLET